MFLTKNNLTIKLIDLNNESNLNLKIIDDEIILDLK